MTTDLDQVIEDAFIDDRLLARTNLFMGLAVSMVAILNSLQGVFGEGKRWDPRIGGPNKITRLRGRKDNREPANDSP